MSDPNNNPETETVHAPIKKRATLSEAQKIRNKWIAAGVGVGIGSAAIAAALLYTNRSKKTKG